MVTLEHTMDDKSFDIKREGKTIGHVMWHKEPLVELNEGGWPNGQLTFSELEFIMEAVKRWRANRAESERRARVEAASAGKSCV